MKTVILAAGLGSRLWPLSTPDNPKQFQPLINGVSPLRHTYEVLQKAVSKDDIFVLGMEGMQTIITEQLPGIRQQNIISVPELRNTLPHTLWALAEITETADEPILFKSGDQYILNPEDFIASLRAALAAYASSPPVLTLLCPKYEVYNTNDGYCILDEQNVVIRFLEKPTKEMFDKAMVGMQVYRSACMYIAAKSTLLAALDGVSEDWKSMVPDMFTGQRARLLKGFRAMPFASIDSAVFQTSHAMRAIEIQYDFVDIGRFGELYELGTKDANGNVVMGKAILDKSRGNLVINHTNRPLVVIGQENMVVVQTPEGSLVSSIADAPLVGDIYKNQLYQQ